MDLPVAIYTQRDAEFVGAEVAVTVPLWSREKLDNNLRLFGDTVKAELDNGEKLPYIPPWRMGANFDFGRESWTAGLDVIYYAKQNDVSSFKTAAYTMVNASFLYKIPAGAADWELFVRGTNLADEEARKSTSVIAAYAPLPGRSLHARCAACVLIVSEFGVKMGGAAYLIAKSVSCSFPITPVEYCFA